MEVEGLPQILMLDEYESDLGWAVVNSNIEAGPWVRAIPVGNGGSRGDPPTDSDGSGKCYVTGNAYDEDLDGGPTTLISPDIDLSSGDAEISFDRWYYNDDGDDPFTVRISSDGGSTWHVVDEQIGGGGGWINRSFNVSDFVTPSDQTRVSFVTQDQPNNSVTEAGVDHFMVSRTLYDLTLWPDTYSFVLSEGCSITFYLDAGPEYAGRRYVLVGGVSGSYPGTVIPGGLTVPINRDWFTDYILDHLNSPMFENFYGYLDGDGRATATLNVSGGGYLLPGQPGDSGRDLKGIFAFTLLGPWDLVSNMVEIEVE
jgi:hypothetical protein